MIEGIVTGDKEVVARFNRLPQSIKQQLRAALTRISIRLRNGIVSNKLQGQVLNVRTGTLQRSIKDGVIESGDTITGMAWTRGIAYARKHEYGYTGTESVKAHLRLVKQVFGRQLKSPVWANVGPHSRSVNYPEKSYMRSELRDQRDQIIGQLEKATADGVH